jgi:drug/metabolite transporter (DMT)-like permease
MAMSIPLALLGALLFAVSAALQQHSARSMARRPAVGRPGAAGRAVAAPEGAALDEPRVAAAWRAALRGCVRRRPVRDAGLAPPPLPELLIRVAREPLWWLGWFAGVAGFTAQAVALHLGSIVVVQALVVTQLLFALPLGSVFTGRRPLRRDWWGAAAVCGGLILLVIVRGGVRQTAGRRSEMWLVVAVAAGLILLSFLTACLLRSHAQSRTVALAAAAGICFCMTAVFLVFAGDDVSRRGLFAAAFGWPAAGLSASTVVGMVLVQNAFAGGSLPTALTAMNITDPVASAVAGVVVFDARPTMNPSTFWATAAAVVLIASGVAVLATSPTLHDHRSGR